MYIPNRQRIVSCAKQGHYYKLGLYVALAVLYFIFLFVLSYIVFTLIIFNHIGLFLVYYLNAQEFCRGLDDFNFYDSLLGNG
jgi:hypothetical protein